MRKFKFKDKNMNPTEILTLAGAAPNGWQLAPIEPTIALATEALEKLARLGNSENYGNSICNDIAIAALAAIAAAKGQA